MICEGCIKQDTCKYKDEVEQYEKEMDIPMLHGPANPLIGVVEVTLSCRFKQTCPPLPNCDTTTYNPAPADWDTTTDTDTDNITYTA